MTNFKRLSAVFLIGGFGFIAACSDSDEDNGNGGTGGSSSGGNDNGTGGDDATGGKDGTGGDATGGKDGTGGDATGGMGGDMGGGAGEGGMGGGTGGEPPVEDDKMCGASCSTDNECGDFITSALCIDGACVGCEQDLHCEYSVTSCSMDSECSFGEVCIKDSFAGGLCAEDASAGCFSGTSTGAKKFADDSDVNVCKKDATCDAGECVSSCSDNNDCVTGEPGRKVCNTDSGMCDACASGTCDECSSDADCTGRGGTCTDGMCTCTEASSCTILPYGGTAVCE